MRPWLKSLSWDQMSFPHCAHKKITLRSGSERTVCKASDCLLLGVGSSSKKSLLQNGPGRQKPLPLQSHVLPVLISWGYQPGSHSWWFIYCRGFLTSRAFIQAWCCFGGCHFSWSETLGSQAPKTVFSHVDTLDVDNEDFLTALQSHWFFFNHRIISYSLWGSVLWGIEWAMMASLACLKSYSYIFEEFMKLEDAT